MRKTIIVGLALFSAWAAAAIWPFATLYGLARSVHDRDVAGVTERVDFPELRRSLTTQIIQTYIRITGIKVNPHGIIAAIAGTIADPIVEQIVSPEAFADMLRTGWPSGVLAEKPPTDSAGLGLVRVGSAWALFANSEYGVGRFWVSLPIDLPAADQFRLRLTLSGMQWRLSGLDLPERVRVKLAEQLAQQQGRPIAHR
jgi:Protein of unknown function (DUF2939)